ncbi:MAG: hypothetical protein JKY19_02665 [Alcanivoracaceae bacterium]|nr:hypothetical protein [Alcanivoracaceae bacterium]
MRRCAILTMDRLEDFVADDKMLDEPMAQCGWQIDHVSWHKEHVDWRQYEAVIIRSTWDYQDDADAFVAVLEAIEKSATLLLNSLNMVKWNINKNYLREVQIKGAEIVPTLWLEVFDFSLVEGYFEYFETEQIVIKPTISANADNTYWLKKDSYLQKKQELQKSLKDRQLMVQPFMQSIVDQGEYSLFYFAGEYSHSIIKSPKSGDFRVQEEHGGQLRSISPSVELLTAANKALQTIPEKVLYARVDMVEHQGVFKIMEIELIEPSLYFNLDETAPLRFAKAFNKWIK